MTSHKLKFVLLQIVKPRISMDIAVENMAEVESLVETYGGEVIDRSIQHRGDPNPNTYIGGGKIEWLKEVVKEKKIDVIVLNDIVKSGQLFRLEQELWKVNRRIIVWDRVGLILAIFDQHAKTREAKLQIELARIKHIGPRIYGLGGTVLSKQGAGIGTRGKGETNIEYEKRHIRRRVLQIEKELAQISTMQQARINRRQRQGVSTVALVGYTSAGKTTLFNALTGKTKQENPKLFTTLDSVLGKMRLPTMVQDVLVSDTIGFIENLPPFLIEAFRSTLMESMQADVLLHVIDASDPKLSEKIDIVKEILGDLPASQNALLVLSKSDMLTTAQKEQLRQDFLGTQHVLVSATSGDGLEELQRRIKDKLTA
jgi:GTPase